MFDESTLLRVADAYERLTDWKHQSRHLSSGPAEAGHYLRRPTI
jgi:hypothetical protein